MQVEELDIQMGKASVAACELFATFVVLKCKWSKQVKLSVFTTTFIPTANASPK